MLHADGVVARFTPCSRSMRRTQFNGAGFHARTDARACSWQTPVLAIGRALQLMEAADMSSFNYSAREIAMHQRACGTQPPAAKEGEGAHTAASAAPISAGAIRAGSQAAPADAPAPASLGGRGGQQHVGREHIVQLLASFEHRSARGRHACMVLEPLGSDLEAVLEVYGGGMGMGIAPAAVRSVTRQLLQALDYLHR